MSSFFEIQRRNQPTKEKILINILRTNKGDVLNYLYCWRTCNALCLYVSLVLKQLFAQPCGKNEPCPSLQFSFSVDDVSEDATRFTLILCTVGQKPEARAITCFQEENLWVWSIQPLKFKRKTEETLIAAQRTLSIQLAANEVVILNTLVHFKRILCLPEGSSRVKVLNFRVGSETVSAQEGSIKCNFSHETKKHTEGRRSAVCATALLVNAGNTRVCMRTPKRFWFASITLSWSPCNQLWQNWQMSVTYSNGSSFAAGKRFGATTKAEFIVGSFERGKQIRCQEKRLVSLRPKFLRRFEATQTSTGWVFWIVDIELINLEVWKKPGSPMIWGSSPFSPVRTHLESKFGSQMLWRRSLLRKKK